MGTKAMVSTDISKGSEILQALEQAKVKVNVVLWAFLSEYEDWRLIISSRQLDSSDPRDAYGLLHDSLDAAGFGAKQLPPILILPTYDPFIKALRRVFSKAKSVEGMRLGGQMFGDRFIEDGYVYKIS